MSVPRPFPDLLGAFKTSQPKEKKKKKKERKKEKSPATRTALAVAKTHPSSSLATTKREESREIDSLFLGLWSSFLRLVSPVC